MPGNNSGRPTRTIESRHRPPGQRWILDGGLRGGGPSRSPFWRTLVESCQGLGSVTLKKTLNTHRTPSACGKRASYPDQSRSSSPPTLNIPALHPRDRIGFFCFPIKHSTHTCAPLPNPPPQEAMGGGPSGNRIFEGRYWVGSQYSKRGGGGGFIRIQRY